MIVNEGNYIKVVVSPRFLRKKNGRWVGYNINWGPSKIEYVRKAIAENCDLSEHAKGISAAVDVGLIKLEIIDQKVYAIPTEDFIKFALKRIQELSAYPEITQ